MGVWLIGRARSDRDQSVCHSSVTGGGEHTGNHGDAGISRDPSDTVCPGPVDRLGDGAERDAEPAHGRLGENHQLRTSVGGPVGIDPHQLQIRRRVGAAEDLRQRDSHGRQLRSRSHKRPKAPKGPSATSDG